MNTTAPADIAKRITADIERLTTTEAVARELGITGNTLRRHLRAPEVMPLGEVYSIARILRADPASYLSGRVEHNRSAA